MPWQRHQDGTFIGVFQKGPGQQRRGMCLKFGDDREVEGTYRGQTGEATRESQWLIQVLTVRASLSISPLPLALGHFPNIGWPANS